MAKQIDVNDLVNGLLEQIGNLSKENAMLKVQVTFLTPTEEQEPGGDDVDGNE